MTTKATKTTTTQGSTITSNAPAINALLAQRFEGEWKEWNQRGQQYRQELQRCYVVHERGEAAVSQLEQHGGKVEIRQKDWAIVHVGDRRVLVLLQQ